MTCRYFEYISDDKAKCTGIHYHEDFLNLIHYEEHCKGNDSSNRTDCRFFPDRTEYRRCSVCDVILQEDDTCCLSCGSKQLYIM